MNDVTLYFCWQSESPSQPGPSQTQSQRVQTVPLSGHRVLVKAIFKECLEGIWTTWMQWCILTRIKSIGSCIWCGSRAWFRTMETKLDSQPPVVDEEPPSYAPPVSGLLVNSTALLRAEACMKHKTHFPTRTPPERVRMSGNKWGKYRQIYSKQWEKEKKRAAKD